MHVMLMAQCYAPEDVSAAILITELATDLVQRGHQVTVVTGAPNYPYGRVFENYRNALFSIEYLEGVQVVRTWSYISPSKATWPRIFHYGTYSLSAFYGGLLAGKPDILLSYSPPLPLGLSAWLLSRLWQVPWVLQLEDLYPDAAVAAGVLRNRSLIAFFRAMERFLYRYATHISLIGENFRRNLTAKNVPNEKLTLIPVWADPELVRPCPKQGPFRERYRLADRFVVMYAGNLGLTSSLEDVLETARLLKEDTSIHFVIVGEGVKKPELEAMAQAGKLQNVIFLPYQPRENFAEMMAAADVNLVTLNNSSSLSSLPSKTFNIMASARPILAITPADSEISYLVEKADCGVNVPPERPELLVQTILSLQKDPDRLVKMGEHGRDCLKREYSRAVCVDMYESMLVDLIQSGSKHASVTQGKVVDFFERQEGD
jgi:colanic acid biosynthesis glycosyl transferase WcaI